MTWTRAPITIAWGSYDKGGEMGRTCLSALVHENEVLAIHEFTSWWVNAETDETEFKHSWHITHVPTGKLLACHTEQAIAESMTEQIAARINWKTFDTWSERTRRKAKREIEAIVEHYGGYLRE